MDKSILVDIIGQASAENLKMYFVTRILKEFKGLFNLNYFIC